MDDVPAVLYHYTSFDAFRKIMESEIVRATHYSELNDTGEIKMGQKILERSLKADDSSIHPVTIPFLSDVVAAFGKGELDPFLFSLSEERDSLYQWRAYCPDGGVAIGFMLQDLDARFRQGSTKTEDDGSWRRASWILVQCEYHKPDATIDVQHIVSNADRLITRSSEEPEGLLRDLLDSLREKSSFSLLEERCCSIKHRAYASEKEWRCFSPSGSLKVQLDERNRRFVEMPFPACDVIKAVVISPHGEKRQGRSLAQHFRNSKELSYDISDSEIPFRT